MLGFTPTVRTSGPLDTGVPAEVRDHLLAVLREAVSNLARHALADHAEVDIEVRADELRLAVVDDGTGLRERPAGERAAQRPPPRPGARRQPGADPARTARDVVRLAGPAALTPATHATAHPGRGGRSPAVVA